MLLRLIIRLVTTLAVSTSAVLFCTLFSVQAVSRNAVARLRIIFLIVLFFVYIGGAGMATASGLRSLSC